MPFFYFGVFKKSKASKIGDRFASFLIEWSLYCILMPLLSPTKFADFYVKFQKRPCVILTSQAI